MSGGHAVTYRLSSGFEFEILFDDNGNMTYLSLPDGVPLTWDDVEEIYQHAQDAEMYGHEANTEGDTADGC